MIELNKYIMFAWKKFCLYFLGILSLFFIASPVFAFTVSPDRGLTLFQGIVSDMVPGSFVCVVSPDGTQGRQADFAYSVGSTMNLFDMFTDVSAGGDWLGNNPHLIPDTLQNGYWRVFSCINSFESDGLYSDSFYVNSSMLTSVFSVVAIASTTELVASSLVGTIPLILVIFAVLIALGVLIKYIKRYIGTSGVSGVGGDESVNSFGITSSEQADIEREVRSRLH